MKDDDKKGAINRVSALFVDDLLKYHNHGGDMNNLTANNVYATINNDTEFKKENITSNDLFVKCLFDVDDQENNDTINNLIEEFYQYKDSAMNVYLIEKYCLDSDIAKWSRDDKYNYLLNFYRLMAIGETRFNMYIEDKKNKYGIDKTPEEKMLDEIFKK